MYFTPLLYFIKQGFWASYRLHLFPVLLVLAQGVQEFKTVLENHKRPLLF